MTESTESVADAPPPTPLLTQRALRLLRRASPYAALYAFYVFLSSGVFLPAFSQLNTALIGKPGSDVLRNVWGYWWFKAMLLERFRVPGFTTYLNFPRGMLILVIDPLNCLLSIPLQLIFGLPQAYNLYLIGIVAFSAFTACLFARYLTNSLPAALIAGTVYGFAPYVLSWTIAGNSEVVNVAWIPVFLLFFHRALDQGTLKAGTVAGIFLVITTLSSWYYGYIVSVFAGFYALSVLLFRLLKRRPIRPMLKALASMASVFALFTLIMVGLFYDIVPSVLRAKPAADLDQLTMLAGNAVNLWDIYQPAPDRWDRPSLYHLPPLILMALPFALVIGFRRAWPWAIIGTAALVLSLSFKVQTYPVEMEHLLWQTWETLSLFTNRVYSLFLKLPFSGMLRFPDRFLVIVNLMIGIILACGLRVVCVDRPRLRPLWLLVAAFASWGLTNQILSVSRFHEIFSMTPTPNPEYVQIIAQDPDWVGVINLPTDLQGSMQLYHQTVHQKPLLNYVDFVTSRLYYVNDTQLPLSLSDGLYGMHLRGFDKATQSYPTDIPDWPTPQRLEQELSTLKRLGLRYIIVERNLYKPESLTEFESLFAPFVTSLSRSEATDLYQLN